MSVSLDLSCAPPWSTGGARPAERRARSDNTIMITITVTLTILIIYNGIIIINIELTNTVF